MRPLSVSARFKHSCSHPFHTFTRGLRCVVSDANLRHCYQHVDGDICVLPTPSSVLPFTKLSGSRSAATPTPQRSLSAVLAAHAASTTLLIGLGRLCVCADPLTAPETPSTPGPPAWHCLCAAGDRRCTGQLRRPACACCGAACRPRLAAAAKGRQRARLLQPSVSAVGGWGLRHGRC
jgi:hypothetical protein